MKRFYEHKSFAYFAIAIVIINLIMTFIVVIPSLANANNFDDQPITQSTSPDTTSFYLGVENGYHTYCSSSNNNTYVFRIINPNNGSQNFCFASNKQNFSAYIHSTHYNPSTFQVSGTMESYNGLYYVVWAQGSGFSSFNVPQMQLYDGLDAINEIIGDNGGGSTESTSLNYNLPAGNVAYIEIGNEVPNISMMSTIMPVKSAAFSSNTGWNSTQRVGFSETLPSSGENLASFGSQIEWIKDGNTNIFGQTQNAKFTSPSLSGHKYLVVVNPLYYAIQYTNGEGIASTEPGVNSTVNNNAVNIFMNYSKGITVYQLTQNVTINNNIPTYTNDVSSGPYEGDINPDTGDVTWTDPDGGSSQPTTGGGNVPGTGENNFSSFLSGVANRIVNVFQPAHDAILTLSNAVQNIASWMYALYIWLPAPVMSILTSAISLAIIIGLIKVFV